MIVVEVCNIDVYVELCGVVGLVFDYFLESFIVVVEVNVVVFVKVVVDVDIGVVIVI